jgi:lipoate-protein ligase A
MLTMHHHLPSSLSPSENLARDEAVLDYAEAHPKSSGFLLFWESELHFVVLGYSKPCAREVYLDYCAGESIPVLRRCTGGGTVLQGPGSFNFALVLPIDSRPELASITSANRFIMERQREVIGSMLDGDVEIRGYTDLVWEGKKFSGNAQRRKRNFLLFHGTFLLGLNLELVEKTIRPPEQQPSYRQQRGHLEFLTNIDLRREEIQSGMQKHWKGFCPLLRECPVDAEMRSMTERLIEEKYGRAEWNMRF